jgi:hypothetical protein
MNIHHCHARGRHSIVKLSDYVDKLVWTAEFCHNFAKTYSTDSVKRLCQVNESDVQLLVLFHTFFLKLTALAGESSNNCST